MSNMYNQTVSLSAAGTTTAFMVKAPASHGEFGPGYLPPCIMVSVSNTPILTYTIEVSGDNTNFVPFTGAVNQTGSFCDALGAAVKYVRLNVTAYTSGTVTFQFCQQVE